MENCRCENYYSKKKFYNESKHFKGNYSNSIIGEYIDGLTKCTLCKMKTASCA